MECSNCYEEYDDQKHIPLNLECGHTFCKQCIKNLLKQSPKLECPICRKRISPFLDVEMLAKNHVVLQNAKTLNKMKSFLNLCQDHHLEPLRFYCSQCDVEICSDCLINHSGHYIKKQDYSKKIITSKINELNMRIKKQQKKLESRMYRNQDKKQELESKFRNGERKIIQFCDLSKQTINKEYEEILKNFKSESYRKIHNLNKKKSQTEQFLRTAQNQYEALNQIEESLKDKKFIQDESQITLLENLEKQILQNLEQASKKKQNIEKSTIKIHLNDDFVQQIQNCLQIVQNKKEPYLIFFGQKKLVLLYRIKLDKWSMKRSLQSQGQKIGQTPLDSQNQSLVEKSELLSFNNFNNQCAFHDYSASCVINEDEILLFGGGKSKDIIAFNLQNFTTKIVGEMQFNRTEHSVQRIGNRIYVMGGFNRIDNVCLSQCEIFHYDQKISIKMADMHNKRCGFSCATYKGDIYVFGGFQGKSRLNEIEKYDTHLNQWELLDLQLPIKLTNGAAVCYNDKIIIFGGDNEDGFSMRPIKIDIENQQTSYKYQLKKGKDLRGKLFQLEDQIYMIGSNKNSGYSFNFINKQWKKLSCYDSALWNSKLDSWTGCIAWLDPTQLPQDYSNNINQQDLYQSNSSYENLIPIDSLDLHLTIDDSLNDLFASDNEQFFQIIQKYIKQNTQKRTEGRIERL